MLVKLISLAPVRRTALRKVLPRMGLGGMPGLIIGAAASYLFDPNNGARRRAILRDKSKSIARQIIVGAKRTGADTANRVRGTAIEAQHLLTPTRESVDDEKLQARVHAKLGRLSSHPKAIDVSASNGCVTLSGHVLQSEHNRVLRGVRRVLGVHGVQDMLDVHETNEHVPDLQGGRQRSPLQRFGLFQTNMPLAYRGAVTVTGLGLIGYAIARRNPLALVLGAIGASLMGRGIIQPNALKRLRRAGQHETEHVQQRHQARSVFGSDQSTYLQ